MALYFCAAACAFYDSDIYPNIPSTACQITAEAHAALMAAQAEGKMIAANDNGEPIAIDRPAPDAAELADAMRRERNALLAASDFTQVPDSPFTPQQREAWRVYRQALRDLPETADDLAAIAWPAAPETQTEQEN